MCDVAHLLEENGAPDGESGQSSESRENVKKGIESMPWVGP